MQPIFIDAKDATAIPIISQYEILNDVDSLTDASVPSVILGSSERDDPTIAQSGWFGLRYLGTKRAKLYCPTSLHTLEHPNLGSPYFQHYGESSNPIFYGTEEPTELAPEGRSTSVVVDPDDVVYIKPIKNTSSIIIVYEEEGEDGCTFPLIQVICGDYANSILNPTYAIEGYSSEQLDAVPQIMEPYSPSLDFFPSIYPAKTKHDGSFLDSDICDPLTPRTVGDLSGNHLAGYHPLVDKRRRRIYYPYDDGTYGIEDFNVDGSREMPIDIFYDERSGSEIECYSDRVLVTMNKDDPEYYEYHENVYRRDNISGSSGLTQTFEMDFFIPKAKTFHAFLYLDGYRAYAVYEAYKDPERTQLINKWSINIGNYDYSKSLNEPFSIPDGDGRVYFRVILSIGGTHYNYMSDIRLEVSADLNPANGAEPLELSNYVIHKGAAPYLDNFQYSRSEYINGSSMFTISWGTKGGYMISTFYSQFGTLTSAFPVTKRDYYSEGQQLTYRAAAGRTAYAMFMESDQDIVATIYVSSYQHRIYRSDDRRFYVFGRPSDQSGSPSGMTNILPLFAPTQTLGNSTYATFFGNVINRKGNCLKYASPYVSVSTNRDLNRILDLYINVPEYNGKYDTLKFTFPEYSAPASNLVKVYESKVLVAELYPELPNRNIQEHVNDFTVSSSKDPVVVTYAQIYGGKTHSLAVGSFDSDNPLAHKAIHWGVIRNYVAFGHALRFNPKSKVVDFANQQYLGTYIKSSVSRAVNSPLSASRNLTQTLPNITDEYRDQYYLVSSLDYRSKITRIIYDILIQDPEVVFPETKVHQLEEWFKSDLQDMEPVSVGHSIDAKIPEGCRFYLNGNLYVGAETDPEIEGLLTRQLNINLKNTDTVQLEALSPDTYGGARAFSCWFNATNATWILLTPALDRFTMFDRDYILSRLYDWQASNTFHEYKLPNAVLPQFFESAFYSAQQATAMFETVAAKETHSVNAEVFEVTEAKSPVVSGSFSEFNYTDFNAPESFDWTPASFSEFSNKVETVYSEMSTVINHRSPFERAVWKEPDKFDWPRPLIHYYWRGGEVRFDVTFMVTESNSLNTFYSKGWVSLWEESYSAPRIFTELPATHFEYPKYYYSNTFGYSPNAYLNLWTPVFIYEAQEYLYPFTPEWIDHEFNPYQTFGWSMVRGEFNERIVFEVPEFEKFSSVFNIFTQNGYVTTFLSPQAYEVDGYVKSQTETQLTPMVGMSYADKNFQSSMLNGGVVQDIRSYLPMMMKFGFHPNQYWLPEMLKEVPVSISTPHESLKGDLPGYFKTEALARQDAIDNGYDPSSNIIMVYEHYTDAWAWSVRFDRQNICQDVAVYGRVRGG